MPNPHPKPSESVARFLEKYILGDGKGPLILTVKSPGGASVNIDGPFQRATFLWTEWRQKSGEPDEDVLQPEWSARRERGESAVHLHLPWSRVTWLRLQYMTAEQLPLIDERVRIAFYAERP